MNDFSLFGDQAQDPVDGLMIGSPPMFPYEDGGLEDVRRSSISPTYDVARSKTANSHCRAFTGRNDSQLPISDGFGSAILQIPSDEDKSE
jgi:hypothetical protein